MRAATAIDGSVIEDVLSWHEVVVTEITPALGELSRSRVCARVVASGTGGREPLGLCRARHAAVEASILASRLRWLGAEHVRAELERLQELVDKTAGSREREAMDYVRRYVAERNVTEIVVTAPARLRLGILDPARNRSRRFGGHRGRRRDCSAGGRGGAATGPARRSSTRRTAGRWRCHVHRPGPQRRSAISGAFRSNVREAIPPHAGLGSGAELAGLADRAQEWPSSRASSPGRFELRTPPVVESAQAWAPGPSPPRAWWSRPAGAARRGWLSPLVARHPIQSAGGACSLSPSGSRVCLGMLRRDFSVCCERTGPGRAGVALGVDRAAPGARLPEDIDEFGAAPAPRSSARSVNVLPRQRAAFSIRRPRRSSRRCAALGVMAVGQSSWGPTVYGIVESDERAFDVADGLRGRWVQDVDVRVVELDRRGAAVAGA